MLRKTVILFIPVMFLWSCVIGEKEGSVSYYYRVTGNEIDVTITTGSVISNVTSLPWLSEKRTKHIDEETTLVCGIEAVNNTSDNATITVEIYVNDDLKAHDTETGPNCAAYTYYSMDSSDL